MLNLRKRKRNLRIQSNVLKTLQKTTKTFLINRFENMLLFFEI